MNFPQIHILAFLLFFPTIILAQLKGTYCNYHIFGESCITFLDSNRFLLSSWTCGQYVEDEGVFHVSNHEILLTFLTDSFHYEKVYLDPNNVAQTDDSVELEITVFSAKTHEPLPFVSLTFLNEQDEIVLGSLTDDSGDVTVKLKANKEPVTLIINHFGEWSNKSIVPDRNQTITIGLSEGRSYENGEELTFRIKRWNEKKLILIGADQEKSTIYERKRE